MKIEEQLLTHLFNCRRVDLYAGKRTLTDEQMQVFSHMKSRLSQGEPLQYILGAVDFMGISLCVDERVLIPRPETEELVVCAIDLLKQGNGSQIRYVLDLGTGSGNIAIAIAKNVLNSFVTTVDISPAAIDLATLNAHENKLNDKIRFICQDMKIFLKEEIFRNKYDLVISNPPYIPTAQIEQLPCDVKKEPFIALDGGEDGLNFYREIISAAHLLLEDNGCLLLEIGEYQAEDIKKIVEASGKYQECSFRKDNAGKQRITIIKR